MLAVNLFKRRCLAFPAMFVDGTIISAVPYISTQRDNHRGLIHAQRDRRDSMRGRARAIFHPDNVGRRTSATDLMPVTVIGRLAAPFARFSRGKAAPRKAASSGTFIHQKIE